MRSPEGFPRAARMHPTVRKCTALLRHQPCPVSDPTPWLAGTFKREDNSPGYTRPLPSIVSCVAASYPRAQVLEFEVQLPFRQMNEGHQVSARSGGDSDRPCVAALAVALGPTHPCPNAGDTETSSIFSLRSSQANIRYCNQDLH